jgi:hypothetical protein
MFQKIKGGTMNRGFLKLQRRILDWEWYTDVNTKSVFIHLLLKANVKESRFHGHEIPIGSCVIGRNALSQQLGISESQVRTALLKLEKSGEITKKATNRFTIINIANYKEYNNSGASLPPTSNQQVANEQPTSNQQVATSKEFKKLRSKEVKKKDNLEEADLLFEEMKEILYKYYPNSSNKLNTTTTKKKLKTKLSEKEFIIKGLNNYLKESKNKGTELTFIKGLTTFLNQETYLDYQESNIKEKYELAYW